MLAKMGWSEGQSLGKDGQGLVEPVSTLNSEVTLTKVDNLIYLLYAALFSR